MRSTPWPKLILRTVKVPWGPLLMAMTRPSKACKRSASPSLILTWTRVWWPGTNSGRSVRLSLSAKRCRSEERRVGKECRYWRDWSSDVCCSDLQAFLIAFLDLDLYANLVAGNELREVGAFELVS